MTRGVPTAGTANQLHPLSHRIRTRTTPPEGPVRFGPVQNVEGSTEDPEAAAGTASGSANSAESPGGGGRSSDGDGDDGGDGDDRDGDGEDDDGRRRLLWLLVLLSIVVVGAGIGTYVLDDQQDTTPGTRTPTETAAPTATPVAGSVSLTADANATLLRAKGVVPGDAGVSRMALRNDGSAAGELAVANLTVSGGENGIASPESSVDDSPAEGELDENLLVRVTVRYSDDAIVRVFGGNGFVSLTDIEARNRTVVSLDADEEVTVVFEWRLPSETDNEVQSDTAGFDVVFGLREPSGGPPGQ